MAVDFSLVRHPRGSWLLRVGRRRYLIGPELGRKLERCEGRFGEASARAWLTAPEAAAVRRLLDGAGAGALPARGGRFIWLRLPLLPAALTNVWAGRLRRLSSTPALLLQLVIGLIGYLIGYRFIVAAGTIADSPGSLLPAAAGAFLATAVWHELGHAAALRYERYPAGGIGAGMLLFIPVLYCDVTAVSALPRRNRLRVDSAGMVFQLGAGGLCFALAGCLSRACGGLSAALQLAGLLAFAAVTWSLLPFMRTDGYWLLCDLLGRSDLEAAAATGEAPRGRLQRKGLAAFLIVYRIGYGLFLLLVCVWLPWRLARMVLGGVWTEWQNGLAVWLTAVLGLLAAVLVGRIWYAVIGRLAAMIRAIRLDLALLFSADRR